MSLSSVLRLMGLLSPLMAMNESLIDLLWVYFVVFNISTLRDVAFLMGACVQGYARRFAWGTWEGLCELDCCDFVTTKCFPKITKHKKVL